MWDKGHSVWYVQRWCGAELVNIYSKYIECKGCKTKKSKDLGQGVLKKNFNQASGYWNFDEKFCLMIRNCVYPYEYMDGWEKFEETKFPPKNTFYSKLNMKCISDNEYAHAQQIWNTMESLGCYHNTYIKIDLIVGRFIWDLLKYALRAL